MIPLALLAVTFLTHPHLNEVAVIDYSSNTAQGHVLPVKVMMTEPLDAKVHLNFLNRDIPCYSSDQTNWLCLAAVSAIAPAGESKAEVLINHKPYASFKINILPKHFPKETLNLSQSKKDLYKKKGREKEVKKIRSTLKIENTNRIWGNEFIRPVEGRIVSDFGKRRVVDGELSKSYHRGVDFSSPKGAPIYSTSDGKVILAGHFILEGKMVMVDHGQGIISAYLHCSKILVKEGQSVKAGELIAEVGHTGVSTSPHLHFGVYIHSSPIDPIHWLKDYKTITHLP